MTRSLTPFVAFLLVGCCLVSAAFATQVMYQSPQQMGTQSALVVRGTVQSTQSYWNASRTKIFTRTQIGVDETYKGPHQAVIDIVQIGGTVGTVKVTVQGALQWEPGEEVLLFVEPYDATTYQVSGFSQGRFEIERDPKTGVAYVTAPSLEGTAIVEAPSADAMTKPSKSEKVTLEQFVNRALGRR
jgi:hypothetical protein